MSIQMNLMRPLSSRPKCFFTRISKYQAAHQSPDKDDLPANWAVQAPHPNLGGKRKSDKFISFPIKFYGNMKILIPWSRGQVTPRPQAGCRPRRVNAILGLSPEQSVTMMMVGRGWHTGENRVRRWWGVAYGGELAEMIVRRISISCSTSVSQLVHGC